jgi:membrane protease YdiL (CAAX protease family)
MQRLIARYPILSFLVVTFAWTWAIWLPFAITNSGRPMDNAPALLIVLAGTFGPNVAAIALTALESGWPGVRVLLSKLLEVRFHPLLWLVLLLPSALWLVIVLLSGAAGGSPFTFTGAIWVLPVAIARALLGGPIAEEIGWRGFLLPRWQARFSPVAAAVLVGIVWGLWHVPVFFVPGVALGASETGSLPAMLRFLLATLAISLIYTWVYRRTRGSLLMAVLLHASTNASVGFILGALTPQASPEMISQISVVYALVTLVVGLGLLGLDARAAARK